MYITVTITKAGMTIRRLALNLSAISQPAACVAAIVVSEMNDRLSPKKAPPTTIAAINGCESPHCSAIPAPIGIRATIVPTLVPIAIEIRHAVTNNPARMTPGGIIPSISETVALTDPIALAVFANAPARMKIQIMSIMSGLPAPLEKARTRSANGPPATATA